MQTFVRLGRTWRASPAICNVRARKPYERGKPQIADGEGNYGHQTDAVCVNSFGNRTSPSDNSNDVENVHVWLVGPRRPVSER